MSRAPLDERAIRRLKLRELRILTAVAQAGTMGKAAAELALSQPAVSKAIAEMEHTLGVPLFDRTAHGVAPTLYGGALLRWARTIFDDLRQGVREIEFLADPTAGEVRIGSHEMMTLGPLPAVIAGLSRQYPRLVFRVTLAPTSPLQYRDLRERRVDLMFGRMVVPIKDEDLHAEILYEDPLVIVASADSKWFRRRKIDPAELINEPWCLPTLDGPTYGFVANAFRALGLELPRQTVESGSPHLMYAMAQTGQFLTVATSATLLLSGKRLGLKALPVGLSIKLAPIGLVTLKNRTISPVAQRFIECAREVCRPLAKHD